MCVIPTGIFGPPPPGFFFMIIGRASSTMRGLIVQPTIVDGDYTGEIFLQAVAPYGPVQVVPGIRIAQALPLPLAVTLPALPHPRGPTHPGSSDVYWIKTICKERPSSILSLTIQGQVFHGLLDTGADTTCFSPYDWPPEWPLSPSPHPVSGVAGTARQVQISAQPLTWQDQDGDTGLVRPYVIPDLPINLWGRDLMDQMGLVLLKCKDKKVLDQMLAQGYVPSRGLGKHLQGITTPIQATSNPGRQGLGFSAPAVPSPTSVYALFQQPPSSSVLPSVPAAPRPSLRISWTSDDPIWVVQWPLTSEKLSAASALVQEQLAAGHIEPTTSPWNTPIFVIKKKSGSWRLLHDLRRINASMRPMGATQPGLPVPTAFPANSHKIVLDLKDCFFSIPLDPADCPRFAFSLPPVNAAGPAARYHWKVLPQGMANSPTLCQVYVASYVDPFRSLYPDISFYHYMDDILLLGPDPDLLLKAARHLVSSLQSHGFSISKDKVQLHPPHLFLGFELLPAKVKTQKLQLRTSHLKTYHDFQQLIGDITWLRPYLKLSTGDLKPLTDLLQGDSSPSSPRSLTPAARNSLMLVEQAIASQSLTYYDPSTPLQLIVLATHFAPTAVFYQNAPLYWIHLPSTPSKVLATYPDLVVSLLFHGLTLAVKLFGIHPHVIITPYSPQHLAFLQQNSVDWALFLFAFSGEFRSHYPSDKLLHFLNRNPVIFPTLCRPSPLPQATLVFTDGSSSGSAAISIDGAVQTFSTEYTSAQHVELYAVLQAFSLVSLPLNLYTDSAYIAHSVPLLETVPFIKPTTTAFKLFSQIQQLILARSHPFFVGHIRAHSNLPGSLADGNSQVDQATRPSPILAMATLLPSSSVDSYARAQRAHALHHLNAQTLRLKYHLTREQARTIVRDCQSCVTLLPVPHLGVNPRGLTPCALWQTDVTHFQPFGSLKFVHVTVDTFSGFLAASLHTGEAAKDVIAHFTHCFSILGTPKTVKTDNGPAYCSSPLEQFFSKFGITHKFGIPHNPQGQGIVERAHSTLKNMLHKLSSKDLAFHSVKTTPRLLLNHALFVLNFLSLDDHGHSAADRLWHPSTVFDFATALWKDVRTGVWKGPHPVLIMGRGFACIHDPELEETRWLPERLIKPFTPPRDPAPEAPPSALPTDADNPAVTAVPAHSNRDHHDSSLDPDAPPFLLPPS